jgi:ABC-2 type transport system permease protein
MVNIILNEWKMLTRNRVFIYATIFFVLSLSLVVWMGIVQNRGQQSLQTKAQEHVRQQWENLESMNPHRAAHYGSFAFKSINLLSSMDGGINDITGNVIQLEGHVQNEIIYSDASQSLSISKFGKLKSSLLLQYVIPLFLIFLTYGSISNEKETQRIKLLIFNGTSLTKLVFAKSLSIWIYGLCLLAVTIMIQIILGNTNTEIFQRLTLIIFAYSVYYYIITSLATYFSARLKNNTSALSSILAIWILWTIFLPKIWGNAVENIHLLPSRKSFKESMREERSQGIDGHNPYDKRREELQKKYLNEYNVDSLDQLPINFDGIVMQADEEYGNLVWDKHFGNNYLILKKQKSLYQISGLLNPFASLQSASMGFCGTDMVHHLDFLRKAEDYRRVFIKELNDKHAYGGSRTGDWRWTVDSTFFKSVDGFSYKTPKITNYADYYLMDIVSLLWWGIITTILIRFSANKTTLI